MEDSATSRLTSYPPAWIRISNKEVDAESELLKYQRSGGEPLFYDSVFLFEDELHDEVGFCLCYYML